MDELTALIDFFNQGWVGVVVGVGFGLLAIYQTLKKSEAKPAFVHSGQKLISSGGGLLPNSVTVQFDGETVPQISLTLITFWNRGNQSINGSDIAENYPLTFSFKDGEVLKAEVIKLSRDPIEASVNISPENRSKVRFSFSFLDPNDGFILKILHTSEITKPEFDGTIKGIPKGVQHLGRNYLIEGRVKNNIFGKALILASKPSWTTVCVFAFMGVLLSLTSIYYGTIVTFDSSPTEIIYMVRSLTGFLALTYFALAILVWTRRKVQAPSPLSIDGL